MSTEQVYHVGNDIMTVWHDGRDYSLEDSNYRQRYGYRIVADGWEYVGNDIRSGCSAAVDVSDAAATLFSFLGACAESRQYRDRNWSDGENADLFPEHVGKWAEHNSDEISMLACELEEA